MIYKASGSRDFVELNDEEFRMAWEFGKRLFAQSQGRLADRRAFTRQGVDGERVQCLGSIVERAVAKALGIYWPSASFNFHAPDLPFSIEARQRSDQ